MRDWLFRASLALNVDPVRRYLLASLCYSTPRKLLNLVRCEVAKRRRSISTRAMPFVLALDTVNGCNLRCPYCLTGKGMVGRPVREIELSHLDRLLDEVADYLLLANIGNWGEPFLSDRVVEVVRRLHQRRIFTTMSTNFSFQKDALVQETCRAGLDYLILSIDGASQASYGRYRRRGKLDLVLENTRRLIEYKRSTGRAAPIVEWQFLLFRHNQDDIGRARALAGQLGVDVFRVIPAVAPEAEEAPGGEAFQVRARDPYCEQLWHGLILNVDGGIAPCCYLFGKDEDFGSLETATVRSIRAGPRYRSARALFAASPSTDEPIDPAHPCLRCELYLQADRETVAPSQRIIGRRLVGGGIGAASAQGLGPG